MAVGHAGINIDVRHAVRKQEESKLKIRGSGCKNNSYESATNDKADKQCNSEDVNILSTVLYDVKM